MTRPMNSLQLKEYNKQFEKDIRKDERKKVLKELDALLHNLTEEMANKYGKGLPERERGEIIGIIDARIEIKKLLKQQGEA